jgi:hypothetical protein
VAIIHNFLLDAQSLFFEEFEALLAVSTCKELIQTGFFIYIVVLLRKPRLLLELDQFASSLLHWL